MSAADPSAVLPGHFTVKKGGAVVPDTTAFTEVVVDLDANRPSMFVLRFVTELGPGIPPSPAFQIGDEVSVTEESSSTKLITGEVTSIEAEYGPAGQSTVIRGYEKLHRLHRSRKYRTFLEQTDSDIFGKVIDATTLTRGSVDATSQVHKFVAQMNQTDWEFLKWRAEENGYVVDMSDSKVNFVKRETISTSSVASLSVFADLLAFRPRVSAPNVGTVTARSWDEKQKQVFEASASVGSAKAAELSASPGSLAGKFGSNEHLSTRRTADAVGDMTAVAGALAARFSDSFIEADAVAFGSALFLPGKLVEVKDADAAFNGKYRITSAKHVFNTQHRYTVTMTFSGLEDRSLLGLVNGSAVATRLPKIEGLVTGIVTGNNDDENKYKVKVKFPWLDDQVESDWMRVVQIGAGPARGTLVMPEVDDEVVVGFEQGDFRRGYVLGGVYNGKDLPLPALSDGIVANQKVVRRGFASRLGHTLVFDDTDDKSGIHLLSADTNFEIYVDQKNTKITIDAKSGKVEIHGSQDVTVKSDANINIEAQQALTLKGQTGVTVESGASATVKATGQMELSGATTNVKGQTMLDLDGGATASLHAGIVKIN